MGNRFKDPTLRAMYDAIAAHYHKKGRDLFHKDGSRNRGSSVAMYFWRGYDGWTPPLGWDRESRTWPAYACWRAAQDIRAKEEKGEGKGT